jgi:hypothetical protein
MACSPEAGLNISATVVVGAGSIVEGAATLALVESDDADDPPHAVNINRAIGTKRFNMVLQPRGHLSSRTPQQVEEKTVVGAGTRVVA